MNHERSVLQIPSPDSTIFVIRHADPAFTIFRTHYSGAQRDTITIALRTDSTEQTRMLGDVAWSSRAWWNGDTLVFWSNLSRGDKKGLNVVRYSLSSDGGTFTALEHFESPMATHDNVWVFDRRPSGASPSPVLRLSAGCHAMRGLYVGGLGYLGYLVGEIGALPVELLTGADVAPVFGGVGSIMSLVFFSRDTLARPMPLCPKSMRRILPDPANPNDPCRASRVLGAFTGGAFGMLAGAMAALPLVLSGSQRATVTSVLVAFPVAGATFGAMNAGHDPPCAAH